MKRLYGKIEAVFDFSDGKHRLLHLILLALFSFILDYEYYSFIYPGYSHLGYIFEFSYGKYFFSKGMLLIILLFVYRIKVSPFIYMVQLTFMFMLLLPALSMYPFHPMQTAYPVSVAAFILLLALPVRFGFLTRRIPVIPHRYFLFSLSALILLLLIPYILVYGFDFSGQVFSSNLEEHYIARKIADLKTNSFISYTNGSLHKILLPALIIYGLITRKWLVFTAGLILMSYLFLTNPHKTIIVTCIAMITFTAFPQYYKKATWIIGGLIVCVFLFKIVSMAGHIMPESLLVRRVLFTPSLIADFYFDIFWQKPVMLSHSIFSSFFEYPYPWEPPHLVGRIFYGDATANCNGNFIADSFMNFSYAGIGVYLLLAVLIFRFIDGLHISPLWYGLIFIFIFQLSNGALLTNMLTHGGIVLLLLLTFFLKQKDVSGNG